MFEGVVRRGGLLLVRRFGGSLFILALFRPDAEVGLYGVGKRLAGICQLLGGGLASAAYQELSELVPARRIARLTLTIRHLSRVWIPVLAAAVVAGVLLCEPAIVLIYGEDYRPAATPFRILLVGTGLAMSAFWAQPLALALMLIKENVAIVVLTSIVSVTLNYALAPVFGMIGTAVGLAFCVGFCHACLLLLIYWHLRKRGHPYVAGQ